MRKHLASYAWMALGWILLCSESAADDAARPATFCNPLNLPYRFQPAKNLHREAADPTIVVYKNEYWLFPSKSRGYWHSPDLLNWTFVKSNALPIDRYAPTAVVLKDTLLWTASVHSTIYTTQDPASDKWTPVGTSNWNTDPDLYVDDNGRLYIYWGCSSAAPILGGELDPATFNPIGKQIPLIKQNQQEHGWEALKQKDWVEGSWMNKHGDTYYLQYAAPGTELPGYGDGVYTSKNPLGPFTFAPYSPFSFKPTGFITSAGHSSTFADLSGKYWHVATMLIGVRHGFERRIGLFPAGFTPDGQLMCNTYLGDYPQYAPMVADAKGDATPGWMLLSYHKPAEASSTLENFPVTNAFDENIRDWWSAQTGNQGEWLKVDLGKTCWIEAIQTNFADQDASIYKGVNDSDAYQYVIETSTDGSTWTKTIDRSQNQIDAPHDYVQLPAPVQARYVRLTNIHCPAGSKFSVSGLRVFGNGLGHAPGLVEGVEAKRQPGDARKADVSWSPVEGADFYIVRYGIAPDKLFTNYQIYDGTHVTLDALNVGVSYAVTVDAVNDSGVTKGTQTVALP